MILINDQTVRVPYGLNEKTQRIDYDRLRETAKRERPKLIWVGGTAYPRAFGYAAMAEIALAADAYNVADIAHVNGLIVSGVYPNPALQRPRRLPASVRNDVADFCAAFGVHGIDR